MFKAVTYEGIESIIYPTLWCPIRGSADDL